LPPTLLLQESDFGKGGQRWLFNSFQSTLGDAQQPHCLAWVEHPVYFLNDKYDSFNLWHALEDVSHAFEAYVLKGWGAEAQVRPPLRQSQWMHYRLHRPNHCCCCVLGLRTLAGVTLGLAVFAPFCCRKLEDRPALNTQTLVFFVILAPFRSWLWMAEQWPVY
jgi:hypothetical protein